MSVRNELTKLRFAIDELVSKKLSLIRKGKFDCVLNDKNQEFRKLFIETAINGFEEAYNLYAFEASKNENENTTTTTIKTNDTSTATINITSNENIINETIVNIKTEPNNNLSRNREARLQSIRSIDEKEKRIITPSLDDLNLLTPRTEDGQFELQSTIYNEINDTIDNLSPNSKDGHDQIKKMDHDQFDPQPTTSKRMTDTINKSNARSSHSKQPQKSRSLSPLGYYCMHCTDSEKVEKVEKVTFHEWSGVYKHWFMKHAKQFKPFRYYVGSTYKCGICPETGTYPVLKSHFDSKHSYQTFVMLNIREENKCAICEKKSENIIEHFIRNHKIISSTNILNPSRLSSEIINELKSKKVYPKFKCKFCDKIYLTEDQIKSHFIDNHKTKCNDSYTKSSQNFKCKLCNKIYLTEDQMKNHFKINHETKYKHFYSEHFDENSLKYLCGICNEEMDIEQLKQHIKNHSFICKMCNKFKGKIYNQLDHHNKQAHSIDSIDNYQIESKKGLFSTKILHPNGLVLNIHNIFKSYHSEDDAYYKFFESKTHTQLQATSSKSHFEKNTLKENSNFQSIQLHFEKNILPDENDISEEEKLKELQYQKKHLNSIKVSGLPIMDKDQNALMDMFLSLCSAIKLEIGKNDIKELEKVTPTSKKLLVTFKESAIRRKFLLANSKLNGLTADKFLNVPPTKEIIRLQPKFTLYYSKLNEKAMAYTIDKKIYRFEVTEYGLCVRRQRDDIDEIFVKSCKELDDFVERKLKKILKRKYYDDSPPEYDDSNAIKRIKLG